VQKGVELLGRTWNMGGGDHCMNSRRHRGIDSPRAPGQQISETGKMVGVALDAVMVQNSTQGWTQGVEQQLYERSREVKL